jgi:hypothetical protein
MPYTVTLKKKENKWAEGDLQIGKGLYISNEDGAGFGYGVDTEPKYGYPIAWTVTITHGKKDYVLHFRDGVFDPNTGTSSGKVDFLTRGKKKKKKVGDRRRNGSDTWEASGY